MTDWRSLRYEAGIWASGLAWLLILVPIIIMALLGLLKLVL